MKAISLFYYKLMSVIMSVAATLNICSAVPKNVNPANGTVSVINQNGYASRLFPMSDSEYLAGYEKDGCIYTAISNDGGITFEQHTLAAQAKGLVCANVNFYESDGIIYLSYRAIGHLEDGSFYGSIRMNVSRDFGKTWEFHSLITENLEKDGQFKGVWEPCLGEINGELVCFYANDSTSVTKQQNIESLTFRNGVWTDRTIISNGEKHNSRDGMPVWCELSDGTFVLVIESMKYKDNGHPFIIQLLCSDDGKNWSEPRDVYIPEGDGSKAAAPGICQAANGKVYITFQTDEDKTEKGDGYSIEKIICIDSKNIKRALPYNFSEAEKVFPEEYDAFSTWGGIYTDGDNLLCSAGTQKGAICNIIPADS